MTGLRPALRAALLSAAMLLPAACSGAAKPASVGTTTTAAPTATTQVSAPSGSSTSSTVPIQAGGPRSVLSPIGLNVRSTPSKTGAVVGTAGQGAVLTVLSHTDGWYQVKGATLTGYITDDPKLSAEGKFKPYNSSARNFAALYPETWASADVPPASVVLRPQAGSNDSIVLTTAASVGQLARGRSGYRQDSSAVVVVCGVTGDLVTYSRGASPSATSVPVAGAVLAEQFLVQLRLTLDAQHALGLEGNVADLAQIQTVKNVMYSLSFPFPQCEQGAVPNSSTTVPASTVP